MLVWLQWLQRIISGSFIESGRWTHGNMAKVAQGKWKLGRSVWWNACPAFQEDSKLHHRWKEEEVCDRWMVFRSEGKTVPGRLGRAGSPSGIHQKEEGKARKWVSMLVHILPKQTDGPEKIGPGWDSPCTGSLLRTSPCENIPCYQNQGPKKNIQCGWEPRQKPCAVNAFSHFSFSFLSLFFFFSPKFLFTRAHWCHFLAQK